MAGFKFADVMQCQMLMIVKHNTLLVLQIVRILFKYNT